jgi:phenylacetate-coenzyme A ligase PaaK-like adenylate-forming protein
LGLINPDESLDYLLADGDHAPTQLIVYPSYLAQLVLTARKRHLQAHDFHLRSIICGSEILSNTLKMAAQETFGASVNDGYSMTETTPVSAQVCSQDHLHHDVNTGFTEIISLSSKQTALAGELGTLVVTPYYPYRACMPVLRYDTRDVVRCLPDQILSCELAGLPATSNILGKADHLLSIHERVITLRDLVEVIEALPSQPWPARFQAQAVEDAILLELPIQTLAGLSEQEVVLRFQEAGIPVKLLTSSLSAETLPLFRPLRSDLKELMFMTRKN